MTTTTNPYFDYILKHPEIKWDYIGLSANPNITWEIVDAYPDKPWDYKHLSNNQMYYWQEKNMMNYVLK
jgi:hypothetical protein